MKDIPAAYRKEDGLHRKSGPQKDRDGIFAATWGDDWLTHFDSYTNREDWIAERENFVETACQVLGLPQLRKGEGTSGQSIESSKRITCSWLISEVPASIALFASTRGILAQFLADLTARSAFAGGGGHTGSLIAGAPTV